MIVVDAGVLISALVDDGTSGHRARERLRAEPAAAPEMIYPEVLSVLRRMSFRGLLSDRRAREAIEDLLAFPFRVLTHEVLVERSWALRGNVTPYDAQYVALAELLGAVLITVDARLSRASGPSCEIELMS